MPQEQPGSAGRRRLLGCAAVLLGRPAWATNGAALALLKTWIEVFNADDPAALAAFDARWRPPRPLAETRSREFRQRTGGFELLRVEHEEAGFVRALLAERGGARQAARIELRLAADGAPPLQEMSLRLVPPDEQPASTATAADDATLVAAAQREQDEATRADRFAGTLLVARAGRMLLHRASGLADRERSLPMTLDSRLRIGSMNKMFTTVAVLQLVEAGRVGLDDPLARLLGTAVAGMPTAAVTVRQLLRHEGGTGDIFGPDFASRRDTLRTHDDYLRAFASRPLLFEPGSQRRYSNFGFVLLGAVIERVSGSDYETHLQQRVFGPAGMRSTGTLPESTEVPGRTPGYTRREGALVSNADTLPWRGTAAGGGYSTTADLLAFARALQPGRLLGAETLALATGRDGAGLGFQVSGSGPRRRFGHGGGAPGMNGRLSIQPAGDVVVAALSNLDPPGADALAGAVLRQLG